MSTVTPPPYPRHIPRSQEDLATLFRDLTRWRDHCCPPRQWPILSKPLTGHMLSLEKPYSELQDPHLEKFEPSDTENMQPVQLSLSTRARAVTDASKSIRLVAPVSIGGGEGYSQVYKGRFQPESCCDPDFIVKIYQGSLSKGFDHVFGASEYWKWERELLSYREEAWAYESLQNLQGKVIPHSYGFYEVTLPHGEPAIIHVMEYIPGSHKLPISDGYESSPDVLAQVLNRLLGAAQNIAVSKLLTSDVASRNVIWPPLSRDGTLQYPVFIDFNRLSSSSTRSRTDMMMWMIVMAREEYEFTTEVLVEWIETNIRQGKEVVSQFHFDLSKVEEIRGQMINCAGVP